MQSSQHITAYPRDPSPSTSARSAIPYAWRLLRRLGTLVGRPRRISQAIVALFGNTASEEYLERQRYTGRAVIYNGLPGT